MNMKPGNETAAICGLFCGTCPSYPNECEGCLSSKVAADCQSCGNGFRECAARHEITRCCECGEFPCERLESFSKKHIVNGICHHEHVIESLQSMKEKGVPAWVEEQIKTHTCKNCKNLIPWFEIICPVCGK